MIGVDPLGSESLVHGKPVYYIVQRRSCSTAQIWRCGCDKAFKQQNKTQLYPREVPLKWALKNEEKFLGHCRRPIYTNSQPFKLIGVATLGADIPTYKQTYIDRSKKNNNNVYCVDTQHDGIQYTVVIYTLSVEKGETTEFRVRVAIFR